MNDRERIEREARECAAEYGGAHPARLAAEIAALVAREVERAVRDEREACAEVCDAAERRSLRVRSSEGARTALDCAAAIRARSAQGGS